MDHDIETGFARNTMTPQHLISCLLVRAAETFERLGAAAYAERARAALRATGPATRAVSVRPAEPTWQERRIADLAAIGLTNKEISERMHLSPRTVSSHLYRVFPKLGIASRAALRDALGRLEEDRPAEPSGHQRRTVRLMTVFEPYRQLTDVSVFITDESVCRGHARGAERL
ncbi:LuxR C-terminal-related transcriptional regulator [Streptomyces sp. NPDC059894]|uniref:helix-turn-helix transcriptional regulator n=1 Tax=unclassified Streptomyces TaxID=2593676 RepID=UPI00365DBC6A